MQHFIDYKQFIKLLRDKKGNINIAESSYLKFKSDVKSVYGPRLTKKYPPPIPNKNLQPRVFRNPSELMEKTKKALGILGEFFNINKH